MLKHGLDIKDYPKNKQSKESDLLTTGPRQKKDFWQVEAAQIHCVINTSANCNYHPPGVTTPT